MDNFELLQLAKDAAYEAGHLLISKYSTNTIVRSNIGKDIKTEADLAAEEIIISKLKSTNIPFVCEEQFSTNSASIFDLDQHQWIIDPLDGTLNFTRGFPFASISIALWNAGNPVLGVIYDLEARSTWSALIGHGAFLNSTPIHVSDVSRIDQAIISSGIPSGSSCDSTQLQTLQQYIQKFKKIRMLGCASLMLAQVAAGRFDAYEENGIYIWDVAAGLALVSAAGGQFRLQPGSSSSRYKVTASNGKLDI